MSYDLEVLCLANEEHENLGAVLNLICCILETLASSFQIQVRRPAAGSESERHFQFPSPESHRHFGFLLPFRACASEITCAVNDSLLFFLLLLRPFVKKIEPYTRNFDLTKTILKFP